MTHPLTKLLEGLIEKPKPALDSIPFPPAKTRAMLELADAHEEQRTARSLHDLWAFITQTVPAVRGKTCHLRPVNRGVYVIDITGDKIQEEGLLFWHPIPDDRLYWFLEKLDHSNKRVEMYDLHQYLISIEPRVADQDLDVVFTAAYGNVGFGGKKK